MEAIKVIVKKTGQKAVIKKIYRNLVTVVLADENHKKLTEYSEPTKEHPHGINNIRLVGLSSLETV